jgi:hypothetical protein
MLTSNSLIDYRRMPVYAKDSNVVYFFQSGRARLAQILDLFVEDSWRINVHAGELEVRPPGAPTTPGRGLNVVKSSRRRRRT